jgi:hypothetical protein
MSLSAAESPPAMYRGATLAMLVSSTSMNVAIVTATAMIHGFTGRAVLSILGWSIDPFTQEHLGLEARVL